MLLIFLKGYISVRGSFKISKKTLLIKLRNMICITNIHGYTRSELHIPGGFFFPKHLFLLIALFKQLSTVAFLFLFVMLL